MAFSAANTTNATATAITAAQSCCLALNYTGNADVGGIGTYVAYGSISIISAICAVAAIWHAWTHNPNEDDESQDGTNVLQKDIFAASFMFWDTVVWFAIAGGAAAIYTIQQHKMDSIYGLLLMLIAAALGLNATVLLSLLYIYPEAQDEDNHYFRVGVQIVAFSLGVWMIGASLGCAVDWDNTVKSFEDACCYITDPWPKQYLHYVVWPQLFIFVVALFYLLLVEALQRFNSLRKWGLALLGICSIAAALYDFWLIHEIREKAKVAFGPSYDDMNFGYGQVIAAGLAAQTFFFFVYAIFIKPLIPKPFKSMDDQS